MIKNLFKSSLLQSLYSGAYNLKFVVIDINEDDLLGCVVSYENNQDNYLATAKVVANGFSVNGITDVAKAWSSIASLISKLEVMCNFKINNVVFASNFKLTKIVNTTYNSKPNKTITKKDVELTGFLQNYQATNLSGYSIVDVQTNNVFIDGIDTKEYLNIHANNLAINVTITAVENTFFSNLLTVVDVLSLNLLGIVHLPLSMQNLLKLNNSVHIHIGCSTSFMAISGQNKQQYYYINSGGNSILQKSISKLEAFNNNQNLDWLIHYIRNTDSNLTGKVIQQQGVQVAYSNLQQAVDTTANAFIQGLIKLNKSLLSGSNIIVTANNINIIKLSKVLNYYFYNNVYNYLQSSNVKFNFTIEDIKCIALAKHYINSQKTLGSKMFNYNINKLI